MLSKARTGVKPDGFRSESVATGRQALEDARAALRHIATVFFHVDGKPEAFRKHSIIAIPSCNCWLIAGQLDEL